jgi:hypothetical protein
MVAWSFFGIRKGAEHQRDLAMVRPVQVVVVGVISDCCLSCRSPWSST